MGYRGHRTNELGEKEFFHNDDAFDGNDPSAVISAQEIIYAKMDELGPNGSVSDITLTIHGNQSRE